MNRLDLPNRCLAEIAAEESDGTAYTDACCRPLGHAHGHMSLAVDDRKEANRRARAREERADKMSGEFQVFRPDDDGNYRPIGWLSE